MDKWSAETWMGCFLAGRLHAEGLTAMYACLTSLLLAIIGFALCATHRAPEYALFYAAAACILAWRLWHDRKHGVVVEVRLSPARLALVTVLYHSLAFSIIGGLPNGKQVVAEIGGFPILAFYPGGLELLAFVVIAVYLPLYLMAFLALNNGLFGNAVAARIVGIFAALAWLLFIPSF